MCFKRIKWSFQVYRYLKSFTDIPVSLTILVGIPEYRYLSTALINRRTVFVWVRGGTCET